MADWKPYLAVVAFLHRVATAVAVRTLPKPVDRSAEIAARLGVVTAAVHRAYVKVGLPSDQFSESFDLLRARKIEQVYHLAARELGKDPEWNTVGDVIAALKD